MRNIERRVKRIEDKLTNGVLPGSALWRAYRDPTALSEWEVVRLMTENMDAPDFVRDRLMSRLSLETLRQIVDFLSKNRAEDETDKSPSKSS